MSRHDEERERGSARNDMIFDATLISYDIDIYALCRVSSSGRNVVVDARG